jgi:alkaline phosphatase
MKLLNSLLVLALLVFLTSCMDKYQRTAHNGKAKNIILLIGDGMGLAQTSSIFYFQEDTPSFTRFQHIGLHQNTPAGAQITDSAAGATAFSAGVKSYNGAIGVDKDTVPKTTILEMAAKANWSTGVIATSTITHATPASFFAHVKSRNLHEDIALDLLHSPVNFFAGGGIEFFAHREDGQNLIPQLESKGFTIDTSTLNLNTPLDLNKRYGYLLASDGMPKMQEGRGDFLPQATQMAIDHLSQDKDGFFLMVEGSQIDWGGHANDSDYIIEETKDFDKAVKVALDFAEKDGNTLVVVTADHETGGYSLSAAEVRKQRDYRHIKPTFSTGGHSASLIPVYAYGPGAANFQGIYQNNDLFKKMLRAARME